MPRRKKGEEHIRNIQKVGPTYHVSLPVDAVRELGWKEQQKVEVRRSGLNLIIKDWKPPKKKKK